MKKISIAAKQGRDSPRKLTTHDFADLPLCPDSLFFPFFLGLQFRLGVRAHDRGGNRGFGTVNDSAE
jgi:hypothetical protein